MLNKFQDTITKNREVNESKRNATASLYHKVFVQNDSGKKLLVEWAKRFCTSPITKADATLFELGVSQGKQAIVKEIYDFISCIDPKAK